MRDTYLRDRQALATQRDYLAQALVREATGDELAAVVEPLARRLLLSPRLSTVLAERLRNSAAPAD